MTMILVTHEMVSQKGAHPRRVHGRGEIVEDALKDDFFRKPGSERVSCSFSQIPHH